MEKDKNQIDEGVEPGQKPAKFEYSLEDYFELAVVEEAEVEYLNGGLFEYSTGSVAHNIISGNIFFELRSRISLKGSSCSAFNDGPRVFIERQNSVLVPDVQVVCGDLEYYEDGKNAILNPVTIVEVLSDSTESYDRGKKFSIYRSIPSFKEYILVNQYKPVVECFYKGSDLDWGMRTYNGFDNLVFLRSIGLNIPMDKIYEGVNDLGLSLK